MDFILKAKFEIYSNIKKVSWFNATFQYCKKKKSKCYYYDILNFKRVLYEYQESIVIFVCIPNMILIRIHF